MIKREGSGRSSGGKSRFEYKERSADDVKKRAEQTGGRFDSIFKQGFDTFRAKEGENVLRILPPTWSDHDHYAYDLYVHSRIGPDNSDYLCLRKMKGEPCPICAASEEAKEAGEADEAKALQPSKKVAMWVVDRDSDAKDPTPAIYAISWMADRDIAALCHDKRKGKVLLIDHPDDGYDLIIKRHGQGLKTRYTYSIDRESSPIDDDPRAQDDVLDFVQETPIPDTLQYRDSEKTVTKTRTIVALVAVTMTTATIVRPVGRVVARMTTRTSASRRGVSASRATMKIVPVVGRATRMRRTTKTRMMIVRPVGRAAVTMTTTSHPVGAIVTTRKTRATRTNDPHVGVAIRTRMRIAPHADVAAMRRRTKTRRRTIGLAGVVILVTRTATKTTEKTTETKIVRRVAATGVDLIVVGRVRSGANRPHPFSIQGNN
jgi:hypothetical protein